MIDCARRLAIGSKPRKTFLIESDYYSSLAPFREFFRTGIPILTYHKLGPRPRRAQLKGLYVSARLFRRQLAELRAEALQSADLDQVCSMTGSPAKDGRIIITVDDGFENALEYGVPALREFGYRAIQFIVADLIGGRNEWEIAIGEVAEPLMDATQIREWLAAGHQIGSHSLTHPFLTRLPLDRAREEIAGSKKKLEDLLGLEVRHFCYPYGDWNPAVRDLVQAAGYQTACTTEFGVNTPAESRFSLKRFTARYRTRKWTSLHEWWSRSLRRLKM